MRRLPLEHARRANDLGVAELDEHRAFRVPRIPAADAYRPHLVGAALSGSLVIALLYYETIVLTAVSKRK
jgi:hypothetical protein